MQGEDVRRGAVRSLEEAIDLRISHRCRERAEEIAGAQQDSPVEHLPGLRPNPLTCHRNAIG